MLALGPHGLMPAIEKHTAWTVAGGALAIMAGGLVLRWKWGHIHDRILNFLTGRETWRGFVTGVWRSFPLWAAYCGVFYCAARAFGVNLPFLSFAGVSAIADAVASLPISVAGLGVREQAFQSLLSLWHGVPPRHRSRCHWRDSCYSFPGPPSEPSVSSPNPPVRLRTLESHPLPSQ